MPSFESTPQYIEKHKFVKNPQVRRETFNPENDQHVASFRSFVATGNWGDVMFFSEFPHTTVPSTVTAKYLRYMLGITDAKSSN